MKLRFALASALAAATLVACGTDGTPTKDASEEAKEIDGVFKVDGDRGLYIRCTGTGSPTLLLEGGDEDTSDSYEFAREDLDQTARTCAYDRANLGMSDPAPPPRGTKEYLADLEHLLDAAKISGPFVLVGTSGGGYISADYAYAHPDQVAGMVFVEVPSPFRDPPQEIVDATKPDSPDNVEKRDYLQMEKDAWNARKQVGDFPMTILSNEYSDSDIAAAEFPSEKRGMRSNVEDQRGWLVLSPQAKQVVVHTGHAVEESDPELVIATILDVVKAAQKSG